MKAYIISALVAAVFTIFILGHILGNKDEANKNMRLNNCSYYAIRTPAGDQIPCVVCNNGMALSCKW